MLYGKFGCTFVENGSASGNVPGVVGENNTFAQGFWANYLYQQAPDICVDVIAPDEGTLLFRSSDNRGRAVYYNGPMDKYRALHSTFIFGALRDGAHTKNELMAMYVDYLTELIGIEEHTKKALCNLTVYPNPASGSVNLSFTLSHAGHVRASIYNVAGQCLHWLMDDNLTAGSHCLIWAGEDSSGNTLGSGTYLVRIEAEHQIADKAIVLIR